MTLHKSLCALLALILAVSCAVPAAAHDNGCDCGFSPVVYVAALGSATLYLDADTPDEKVLFRMPQEDTLKIVGRLVPPLLRFGLDKNYDALAAGIAGAVKSHFGPLAMDANGNSDPRVTTKTTLPTDPTHGPDRDYYFGYDFRADPLVTAGKLDDYIRHVKALTGHDKVSLKASSLGGIIVMAYFEQFGWGNIDACIFQCCPILGVAVAGDLFTKQIEFNADALVRYGTQVLPESELGTALDILIQTLHFLDVFGKLLGFADTLVVNMKDALYDELLIPVFGNMPGLWSLVPDVSYEQAKSVFFDDTTSPVLLDRLDYYHYSVQMQADAILNAALDDGVRILILAGYNLQREPFVASYLNHSDAVDDTIYNAPGVTCALLGETLGDDYVQAVDDGHNHLSADGILDASTCYLPENTWFIKDMLHSTPHAGTREFYTWFLTGDTGYDVHTDARYPQFMQNDATNARLLPLTEAVPNPPGLADLVRAVFGVLNDLRALRFA